MNNVVQHNGFNESHFKKIAQAILKDLRQINPTAKLSMAYDIIAKAHNYDSWSVMSGLIKSGKYEKNEDIDLQDRWHRAINKNLKKSSKINNPVDFFCDYIFSFGLLDKKSEKQETEFFKKARTVFRAHMKVLFWEKNNVVSMGDIKAILSSSWLIERINNAKSYPEDIIDDLCKYANSLPMFADKTLLNEKALKMIEIQHSYLTAELLDLIYAFDEKSVFDFS